MNLLEEWQQQEAELSAAKKEPMALLPNVRIDVDLSAADGLDQIEGELLKDAVSILHAAGKWADVDPEHPEQVPSDWPVTMTKKEIKRAMRIALAANKNAKEAPIGLSMAKSVAMGIISARHKRSAVSNEGLNVAVVQLPPVTVEYRVMEDKR